MRKHVYHVATTLDGRIAGPHDDFSGFLTEGDHFDTIFRDYADALPREGAAALGIRADRSRFDTVLMGWTTYAAGFAWTSGCAGAECSQGCSPTRSISSS